MKMSIKRLIFALSVLMFAGAASADKFADAFEAAASSDYNKAVQQWEPLARKGHPDAQLFLALMYHSGVAGYSNEKEAVKWYHKAAENGNYTAQEYLATAYREGWFGLKKSSKKASFWEAKLAKH